jgi:RimJ/RimL family protein N-acetyltransferase
MNASDRGERFLMTERITLRPVVDADVEVFHAHQLEPDACEMASFPSRGRAAHLAHWKRIRGEDRVVTRTVLLGGEVVGNIVCWDNDGRWEVGYWIGKRWWGHGVASAALSLFVEQNPHRPLHAVVAATNLASIRVLERCGFEADGDGESQGDAHELTFTLA